MSFPVTFPCKPARCPSSGRGTTEIRAEIPVITMACCMASQMLLGRECDIMSFAGGREVFVRFEVVSFMATIRLEIVLVKQIRLDESKKVLDVSNMQADRRLTSDHGVLGRCGQILDDRTSTYPWSCCLQAISWTHCLLPVPQLRTTRATTDGTTKAFGSMGRES